MTPTTDADRGTVTVAVNISGFDEENDAATLSFRQGSLCDVNGDGTIGEDDEIEVHSIPVVSGGIYDIELPPWTGTGWPGGSDRKFTTPFKKGTTLKIRVHGVSTGNRGGVAI